MKNILKFLTLAFAAALTLSCVGVHEEPAVEGLYLKVDKSSLDVDKNEKAVFTVLNDGVDVTGQSKIVNITDGKYEVLDSNVFVTYRPSTYKFCAVYDFKTSDPVTVVAATSGGVTDDYLRGVCILKFTGTWCSYCPLMSTAIEQAAESYPGRLTVIEAHSDDALSCGSESQMKSAFNVTGFPTVVTDFRMSSLTTQQNAALLKKQIQKSLDEYPATCGIKVTTALDEAGTKVNIDCEVKITSPNKYRLNAALLLDGVVASQSGSNDPNYTHNNIYKGFFSGSMTGDDLGDCTAGQKCSKHYELKVEKGADLSNYRVAVFVTKRTADGAYNINNIVNCHLGSSIDYQYETTK